MSISLIELLAYAENQQQLPQSYSTAAVPEFDSHIYLTIMAGAFGIVVVMAARTGRFGFRRD